MTSFRDAVLEGTLEAAQIHADSVHDQTIGASVSAVDVFKFIDNRQIDLMFRKLGGLLGAYLRFQRPGILVTTERSLAIQRFTAAHELGHAVLKHSAGVDDDSILARTPFGGKHYDPREVAADTFAAMFLMPEFLINAIAERQKWDYQAIRQPEVIYQMSLRLGVSYEALTRTLVKHGVLQKAESSSLLSVPVKRLKQSLLGTAVVPDDWRCNVWSLTEKDEHTAITAEPNDFFVVRLREMSGAGYLWNINQVIQAGFQVVADQRELYPGDAIGGDVERVLTTQATRSRPGLFAVEQNRPWDPDDVAAEFDIRLEIKTTELGLLPDSVSRRRALAA
jgi:Zn-dependent peptidase ImmA (M78 family)